MSKLVIAAFWAEGDVPTLCENTAEAVRGIGLPDGEGAVVAFPKATVEDRVFTAILRKLDLAEVVPSFVASFIGGPRDNEGGIAASLDPIRLDGGEYRFQEMGTDLDAVFTWHPKETTDAPA